MKRVILSGVILLILANVTRAQITSSPEVRTFELTAVAPPTPALKYQLIFDDLGDRIPGNAAILYLDSILMMPNDAQDQAENALKAYAAGDTKNFDALADTLDFHGMFQELDLAGRRETCDWQPPFREMGAWTYLPHLAPMAHGLTSLIRIRALRQMEQGQVEDALRTLRLGYEMSNNIGQEGILISGLVASAVTGKMNDTLSLMMNRPDCPNLYWALSEFPRRAGILRKSMDGERQWWVTSFPTLNQPDGRGSDLALRAKAGENLSAQEWRDIITYAWSLWDVVAPDNRPVRQNAHPDPVKDAGDAVVKQATDLYIQRHNVTPEQAATVDPIIVMGEFYFYEGGVAFDDFYKLRGLTYPQMLVLGKYSDDHARELAKEQPGNPFLPVTDIRKAASLFGQADRQLAALTALEAIRSYAAAHGGKLPDTLDDITDTPVPMNPLTGQPFEYKVSGDEATLSDTQTNIPATSIIGAANPSAPSGAQTESPLTYTIHIRK